MTVVEIWAGEIKVTGSRGPLKLTVQYQGEPGPNEHADLAAQGVSAYRRAYQVWSDGERNIRFWKLREEEVREPERIPDPEELA